MAKHSIETNLKKYMEKILNPKAKSSVEDLPSYKITLQCSNCGYIPGMKYSGMYGSRINPTRFSIPKGIAAQPLFVDVVCPHCECKGFMKVET